MIARDAAGLAPPNELLSENCLTRPYRSVAIVIEAEVENKEKKNINHAHERPEPVFPKSSPNPKFHNTLTLPLKTPSASRKLLVPGLARAHPLRYFSTTNDKRYITALNTIPIETPK
jgi:hypothetical protein